jgi:hypothetical protein
MVEVKCLQHSGGKGKREETINNNYNLCGSIVLKLIFEK